MILRRKIWLVLIILSVLIKISKSGCGINCLKCSDIKNELSKCTECRQGFGKVSETHCSSCRTKNCLQCDETLDNCSLCNLGSFLIFTEGKENPECMECVNGCGICNNTKTCQECKFLYQLNQGNTCSPKYWLFILLSFPTLICVGMSFCYSETWEEDIKKNE